MATTAEIEQAIMSLDGGEYQRLMDAYLCKKCKFKNIMPYGSDVGSNKTTKGTPDSYVIDDDGKYIFIQYGHTSNSFKKVKKDIEKCLDESITHISKNDIKQIICCFTTTNISPSQRKELDSMFENLILINIREVAQDICYHFQTLARDYLNLNIDTHQIFDIDDFIRENDESQFSTPLDMKLLCRDREKEELKELIKNHPVVVVTGKSGIGKTKLTLEASKEFCEENNFSLKIIKSNGEPIYDDLVSVFDYDTSYLVMVDDANELTQLNLIFQLCNSFTKKYKLKIVMTVRDYAKKKVYETALYMKVKCNEYPLKSIKDEDIKKILSENLEINNPEYQEQILNIAKGNIRLAIMAGKCIINKTMTLYNAIEVFDIYFYDRIKKMNTNLILVAGIIAIFDSFIIKSNSLPLEIANEKGISYKEFCEACNYLHKEEIVNIFAEHKAVKFNNQNMRDYILYYVFYKEKLIQPSYIIKKMFPKYRSQIVYAFYTLIQLFYTKDYFDYLQTEIKFAWQNIKNSDNNTKLQFIESFIEIIPIESLSVIKNLIENLPEYHSNLEEYDFMGKSHNHNIKSQLILILARFKNTDLFSQAIALSLKYLERNTEYPMDFYFLFTIYWGFNENSHKYKYKKEEELLEKLYSYYQNKNSITAARYLILYVEYCLRFQFNESYWGNRFKFITFSLYPDVYNLRDKCFDMLSQLYRDNRYRKYVIDALMAYSGPYKGEHTDIVKQDMNSYSKYFGTILKEENFQDCCINYHFYTICRRLKIQPPDEIKGFRGNNIFRMYIIFSRDYSIDVKNFKERMEKHKHDVMQLSMDVKPLAYKYLWNELSRCQIHCNNWFISESISITFESLITDKDKFLSVLDYYIDADTPFDIRYCNIISSLLKVVGFKEALQYLERKQFSNKNKWLTELYNYIPDDLINKTTIESIFALLDNQHLINPSTILKINSIDNGFAVKYLAKINDIDVDGNLAASLLIKIDYDEGLQELFVQASSDNISLLEDFYIKALQCNSSFDYFGNLLIRIVDQDRLFVNKLVKFIHSSKYSGDYEKIMIFWKQSNYKELIQATVDAILLDNKQNNFSLILTNLFSHKNNDDILESKQEEWLNNYIKKNSTNINIIQRLFSDIRNLPEEQRMSSIITFCENNKNFEDFKKIYLFPNMISWWGSEIPTIEQKISFLREIKGRLAELGLIEHANYLEDKITKFQQYKQQVSLSEFLENIS